MNQISVFLTDAIPELLGLFFVSFLAATLLPLGSELLLLSLVSLYPDMAWYAWGVASLGNTLGGMTNWWLGAFLLHFQTHRFFPVSVSRLAQVQGLFSRYGQPMLLFGWLPVIGDALCLAAGVAKIHWLKSLAWILIGKSMRYGALILGTSTIVLS